MNLKRTLGLLLGTLAALDGPGAAGERQPDHSRVPGVVVSHSPAASGVYLGSPSLAIMPDGGYVASHDFFGPKTTESRTAIFGSSNKGKSWRKMTEIEGQFWSTVFWHRGALYLLGTGKHNGPAVIRRSIDGGQTWTTPVDRRSGLLGADGGYHCAPVPVVVHNGRIWRGMEDTLGPAGWGSQFRAFMMSAPVDADLLDASNWTLSQRLGREPAWLGGKFGGWLEGNAVVSPEGEMLDILRVDYRAEPEKAAIIKIGSDGKEAAFDPASGFIEFPGGCKKFTIRRDPSGGTYWSLSNHVPASQPTTEPERTRNTLALICSTDLRQWSVRSILLHHPDSQKTGFQYADWQFEADDIVALVRTAFDDGLGGAHNQHDANYIAFHRFARFRTLK